MILLLAGSSEGKEALITLREAGYDVIASTASAYGGKLLDEAVRGNHSRTGPLDWEALIRLIREKQVDTIVDATHPFALEISQLAMLAADGTGISYIRLERPGLTLPRHPLLHTIQKLSEIKHFVTAGQTLFSTIGSRHLAELLQITTRQDILLVARVLPASGVLHSCEEMGLDPEQIIAMKGPFSREMNRQQFLHYQADVVLSKESGNAGGLDTKIEAALDLGIPILVWLRPTVSYPLRVESADEVLKIIQTRQLNKGGYR